MTDDNNGPLGIVIAILAALVTATGYYSYTGYGIGSENEPTTIQFVREDSVGSMSSTTTGRRTYRSGGTNFGK